MTYYKINFATGICSPVTLVRETANRLWFSDGGSTNRWQIDVHCDYYTKQFMEDNCVKATRKKQSGWYDSGQSSWSASQQNQTTTQETVAQVKAWYRREAKRTHPDSGGSAAAFKEATLEYERRLNAASS